jgi:hypothetical protein
MKNRVVKISIRQAINLGKKFGVLLTEDCFKKFNNNDQVFYKINEETGVRTVYLLQRFFKQKFNLNYSVSHNANSKKQKKNELIMSNCKMPNINKFIKK